MKHKTVGKAPLTYDSLVDYLSRRLVEHGESDAQYTAAQFERNLGLDKNKLVQAARKRVSA